MKRFVPLLLLTFAGCSSIPKDIVQVNPQYSGPYKIEKRQINESSILYVFRGERGIFSFDLLPPSKSVQNLTFLLKDQRKLTSLSIHPVDGDWISLYSPESLCPHGVVVVRQGDDWHATFTGQGLDLLRKGGRFQVIDEYRR